MKLVGLIKLCLNEICSEVHEDMHLFLLNGLKQGDALLPLLFTFAVVYTKMNILENQV
jgi:hypothetical protein